MTKSQYEWLAHRFENMTAKEALLFRGAMQIEQPQATCDVMQIANQLEHYELLYGAGNDFALGNFVMEHIFYPSSQTREFLDPAKVGAAYRQKDGNTFCDGNFIRLSSPLDLSQNSDPAMLPDRGDYGIRVKLASRNNMEGIWVGFPDTLDEGDIHDAVISAMNELFQTQAARNAVKASISAVLAGEEQTLSLPAVELQIRNLQERQLELFQLIVSAGADCTDYDEELRQVNMAKTKLMAKKAELEKEQRGAAAFEERLAELDAELEQSCGALTDFDELTVRQLVSNIKVLDKDSLLICFKDGTEITQAMQRRQTA